MEPHFGCEVSLFRSSVFAGRDACQRDMFIAIGSADPVELKIDQAIRA